MGIVPKTVLVTYFATLRETAGVAEEQVTTSACTLEGLYTELANRHGFTLPPRHIKASRNLTIVDLEQSFGDGDAIVLLPPVAGG
jgi:molybdopterin converting factor small subunit